MTTVIKRNKAISELDIKEIRKALVWAGRGLEDKINYLELESHVAAIYKDRISTEEIQKSLIDIALKLTSVDEPEWRILAARLCLMELYKEIALYRGTYPQFGYTDYLKFLKEAVSKGIYDESILKLYSEEELREAEKFINADFDMNFDYAGITMLINRYLLQDHGRAFEQPQEMFLTIALLIASTEKKEKRLSVAKDIYEHIAGKKISLATPILINLRRPNGNLSSCFISASDDSLDSIFYNINAVAQISKNGGGVGINLSRIRGTGAEINKTPNASGGVVPWIKIINDTAVAVNQLGKRAGAVTVALDIWHLDIEDFLELQSENGDQRKKAYDIFPQVVIPDLFMKRVEEDNYWTLLEPNEVRLKYNIELAELWGDNFEQKYAILEKDENLKLKRQIKAKELFKRIMKTQIETGMPYLFFKDTVNRDNPNQHKGMIGSGNLCQESFSNFSPTKVGKVEVDKENNIIKQVNESGYIHTCNLVSLNLSILLEHEELEKACETAVRILDNTIDLTSTPIGESDLHNSDYRTIGVGAMGLADYLAYHKLPYKEDERTLKAVDELFEFIGYNVVKTSINLAEEKGAYPLFKGSQWEKGIFFGKDEKWFRNNSPMAREWIELIEKIKISGIRNSQLLAIAPNTSSALVQGCSASVLPIFNKFYMDKNAKGAVPVCPPYIKEAFWYYRENKTLDQREVVKVIAKIQKWIDQGISFELLYNLNLDVKAKDIYETLFDAWKNGCKTIYYTRTIQKNSNSMTDKDECSSCAG
jgi:ribonucleoside-diphosphate reductase alpha chain